MASKMSASIATNDNSCALQSLTLTEVKPLDEAELGRGAYGKVFKVEHKGVFYAAKEIHQLLIEVSNTEEKEKIRNDFLRECYNCSKLHHPNIVKFVGIYYAKENLLLPVMVMELMGESLTKYVKQPEIYVRRKISILHNVASGVSYLHNYIPPIIHRDLSPNNILMSRDPNPVAKLSDLGVAKVVKADSKATKSMLTKVPGTADFMPPECLVDNPIYDTSLDIFSYAGIVLHVINQEWPTPTAQFIFDQTTGELTLVDEIKRRQDHINKMRDVGGVNLQVLQDLVENCLQKIASKRPGISDVLKVVEQVTKSSTNQPSLLLTKEENKMDFSASGYRSIMTNQPSLLLTKEENEMVFRALGSRRITMATAVVQVYHAHPDSYGWTEYKTGVVCFVKDNLRKSYYIRLFEMTAKGCLIVWEQEIYNQFTYYKDSPYFHQFPGDKFMVGLNFSDENEADVFYKSVESKISDHQHRRQALKQKSYSNSHFDIVVQPSLLLTKEENEMVFSTLGAGHVIKATAVVQVYHAHPDSHGWTEFKTGVVCFVEDDVKKSCYIRLLEMTAKGCMIVWEQEIYDQFTYYKDLPHFHQFPGDKFMVGLNFSDENEADVFYKAVEFKLKNCHERTQSEIKFTGQKGKRKKINKSDISAPPNFKHLVHVGWDPNTGAFDSNNIDAAWKKLFDSVGVSDADLKDGQTAKFIYDFVEQHGGIEKANQRLEADKQKPPPPPSSYGGHRGRQAQRVPPPPPPNRNPPPN